MSHSDTITFDEQLRAAKPRLQAVIRRIVGHPDETDDLVQQAMLQAFEHREDYNASSAFSTWLCAIGANIAVDHLRRQKRWRTRAQVAYANECLVNNELAAEVGQVYAQPDFAYDVNEHISYCFACVGRSLNADEYAAVVLREVLGLGNREAAGTLGISESVLRHRLAAGRRTLTDSFEGLCSLVNKQGVCYQCKGLRDIAPADRQGPALPENLDLDARLRTVTKTPGNGHCEALHDVFWRRTGELEKTGRGSTDATQCGTDKE